MLRALLSNNRQKKPPLVGTLQTKAFKIISTTSRDLLEHLEAHLLHHGSNAIKEAVFHLNELFSIES